MTSLNASTLSCDNACLPSRSHRAIVERSIEIDAPADVIFESILEDMQAIPDGNSKPLNLKLEPWPGGRWYRDLGNNAGHLWGHVQVIKPPTVLEVYGPLMISSAAISHVTYRVAVTEGKWHRLTIKHRIFGDFDPSIPENVGMGWNDVVNRVKAGALSKRRFANG